MGFALEPKRVNAMQTLDAMTPEQFETLLEDYAAGDVTWETMASSVGASAVRLQQWIASRDDVKSAFHEAKIYRAERLADSTIGIANEVTAFTEDIQKAALKVKTRQWMAEKLDPTRFGKQAKQTVNIGSLHLTAVREINAAETQRRVAAMGRARSDFETRETLPAEIVPEDEDDRSREQHDDGDDTDLGDLL
jgi:hypothetical protein